MTIVYVKKNNNKKTFSSPTPAFSGGAALVVRLAGATL